MTAAVGTLPGRVHFVRFGTGARPLVVLPGLAIDNVEPSAVVARSYSWGLRRVAAGRTVTVLQRPHGLGDGVSTAGIADRYAGVLREELGPADVMALSTGGLIAQHLALRHPDLVRRLVLVVSGAHLAEPGRRLCQQWRDLAARQDWRALRGDLAAAAVDGAAAQWLARRLGGTGRAPSPADAADFAATTAADLAHDTRGLLSGVAAPTLVLGGRDDPFFPEDVLAATAAEFPDAKLHVHAGGHGVPKHHARWLQQQVAEFLDRPLSSNV